MKNVKTIPMDVSEQLKNVASKSGENLEVLRKRFIQERWLCRLSNSTYQEKFLLAGDHALFAITNGLVIPSTEIVLSAKQITHDVKLLQHVFKEVCAVKVAEDGVDFQVDDIKVTTLERGANIEIPVTLGDIHTYLQIIINFGDQLVLKPKTVVLPTVLEMAAPTVFVYPAETMIAEKFEAMISRVESNDRMKDFYDVYMLLTSQSFEGRVLQEAMLEIFDRRKAQLEKGPFVLSKQFYLDEQRNKQWHAFIEQPPVMFAETLKRLQVALLPIYNAVLTEEEFFGNWDCALQDWK